MAEVTVVLMAYGTPRTREEIEPYYTDIRRGNAPTPEALADLTARYDALGGTSPLAARTEAQRDALQRALDDAAPGQFHVALGLKHADPKVEAAVDQLAAEGFTRIVGLVLAPHYSAYSVGQYHGRASERAAHHGIEFVGIDSWATEPAMIEFVAADLRRRLDAMPTDTKVLFTAHSLPQRIVAAGDPYPDELRSTAEAVAAAAGLSGWSNWAIAWQSAGRTPEPWLGPDILTVIDDLAAVGVMRVVLSHGGGPSEAGAFAQLVRRQPTMELTVAGGVQNLDGIRRLRDAGVAALILGEPLFSGAISLDAARSVADPRQ